MSVDPTDCPECSGYHPGQSCEPEEDTTEYEGCQAEFIDGSWYGDDCPDCRASVESEMGDCEQCEEEDYCSKHTNGVYG